MKLKQLLLSWDFVVSFIIAVILYLFLPIKISNLFTQDLYEIGISVLSIIFSVFFASLAIIISSGDDGFTSFLEKEGDYTVIIHSFTISLCIIFIALIYSLFAYGITSYRINSGVCVQNRIFFIFFSFLSLYGMFAVGQSTYDSIKYTKFRSVFTKTQKDRGE